MISTFAGRYDFLSNFYLSPFTYDGHVYKTVEHAFQAMKTLDPTMRGMIRNAPTPADAKRMGRAAVLRPEWDEIRNDVMLDLLRLKFRPQSGLADCLVSTGDEELVEGNTWGDTYWGVCNGRGENWLGVLLMMVREELGTPSAM